MAERSGNIPFNWHLARWMGVAPGQRGLVVLALFTAALLVPFDALGLGKTRAEGARAILSLGIVAAAFLVCKGAAVADELEFWLMHKRVPPSDWAFAKWRANLLPLVAVAMVWAMTTAAATAPELRMISPVGVLLLAGFLAGTALLLSVLLFALESSGTEHAAELALLMVLLAAVLPAMATVLPAAVLALLRIVLPPVLVLAQLRDAAQAAEWTAALRFAVHIASWCFVLMLSGVTRLQRRAPKA